MSEPQGQTLATATAQRGGPDTSEPAPERQANLRAAYEANVAAGKPPYEEVEIRTLGELTWILRERDWSSAEFLPEGMGPPNLSMADLSFANLYGFNLRRTNLSMANLSATNLSEAFLWDVNLSGASAPLANLRHADLLGANLSGASLMEADLLISS